MYGRRRATTCGKKHGQHSRKDRDGDQRIGERRDHQDPAGESCLRQQKALRVQRRQADLRALGEELPQKEAEDQIQTVVRIGDEHQ